MKRLSFLLKNQKGVILLLTLIIMVTLSVIAMAYVSLATYNTKNVGGQENNVKAFYLAMSGLMKANHYLLNTAPDGSTDGSWRTTAYPAAPGAGATDPQQESLGEGTYTMWVETSGGNIQITARGTVNNIQRIVRQTETYSTGGSVPEAFTYATFAGGNIDFSGSGGTANVDGSLGTQGSVDQGGVPVSGDIDENISVVIPTVDYAEYENIADTVVNGDKTFSKNSISNGIWYVKGNVEIKQNAIINGTIIAEGNISFTGNNGTVTATAPYPALVAQGNIESNSNNNLTISGAIFSDGNLAFNDSNNFTFDGSIAVSGNIELSSANNFDITFVASNPPFISGGEVGGGDSSIDSVANSWGEL